MKREGGFTLIEIMISVTIVAILAVMGIANYPKVMKKGRDGRRTSDLAQIQGALELYRADKKVYPNTTNWKNDLELNNYIKKVPVDPNKTGSYVYQIKSGSNNKDYYLCAKFEGAVDTGFCTEPANSISGYDCCVSRP